MCLSSQSIFISFSMIVRLTENEIIMVYLNTYTDTSHPTATSLLSSLIFYSPTSDTISFSKTYPIYKYRDGGISEAENYYKHLSIQTLSPTTFGVSLSIVFCMPILQVFYSNSLVGERMCFLYVHITALNTILPSSEQYILSDRNPQAVLSIFFY